MEQRISLLTLGVSDLEQSKRFYEALGAYLEALLEPTPTGSVRSPPWEWMRPYCPGLVAQHCSDRAALRTT